MKLLFLALVVFANFANASSDLKTSNNPVPEAWWIKDVAALATVRQRPEFIIDHVKDSGFELYGPPGTGAWLDRNQIPHRSQAKINRQRASDWLNPQDFNNELTAFVSTHPDLAKVFSIGKSSQGIDLLVVKISKNVQVDDKRPEFKYIANMHGDEIVGRDMMLMLIRDLVQNYNSDPQIKKILDETQVYILPSMNPDGAGTQTRFNAENIDLNRNFPDWTTTDNQDVEAGRAVETQAVMKFEKSRHFILSANFHGGAEVVNYPWDAIQDKHPLDDLVKSLSLGYASLVPYISQSTEFTNGITNGWAWYEVKGGMQDWSWYYHKDLQLTIELSEQKWPAFSSLGDYYQKNRPALLEFIEQAQKIKSAY